jgi:replication factor C subunit 2/4
MNLLWVEKYRPSNLSEISSQTTVINSLKSSLITKNIPHLIFYGPSGCGKTSTILALAKELFGNNFKDRVIELNASDERGINIIRDKIKVYAKQSVNTNNNISPWKLIILDEADTMTSDSQFALRRIIEEYSKVTRFCIICNYHNKIIDPIISRCSFIRFKPISDNDIIIKLKFIANKENIKYDDDIYTKIVDISRGDMRKAINLLQKCTNSCNLLDEISGYIPEIIFNELINNINNKNIKLIEENINSIYLSGYSIVNQIRLFHNYILSSSFSSKHKSELCCKLVEIDQNLINGCDEYIQFIKFIYYIIITV